MRILLFLALFTGLGPLFATLPYCYYEDGTRMASPIWAEGLELLTENVEVLINKDFESATVHITWTLRTDTTITGPLLLLYVNLPQDLQLALEGKTISLNVLPEEQSAPIFKEDYLIIRDSLESFRHFAYYFEPLFADHHERRFFQNFYAHRCGPRSPAIMIANASLEPGEYTVEMSYIAIPETGDRAAGRIKQYSFSHFFPFYKEQNSLPSLQITVDATLFENEIETQIAEQTLNSNKVDGSFPGAEKLIISFVPEMPEIAKWLLRLPYKIYGLIGISLLLHLLIIRRYKRNAKKKKRVYDLGCLFVPLLITLSPILFEYLISFLIGEHGHAAIGFRIFVVILFPLVVVLYWGIINLLWMALKALNMT